MLNINEYLLGSQKQQQIPESRSMIDSNQSNEWHERSCAKVVAGALGCTTIGGCALAAFSWYAPFAIPNWVLVPIGFSVSVVSCLGGCCLARNIPHTEYEEKAALINASVNQFVDNNKEVAFIVDGVNKVAGDVIEKLNEDHIKNEATNMDIRNLSMRIEVQIDQIERINRLLAETNNKQNEVVIGSIPVPTLNSHLAKL